VPLSGIPDMATTSFAAPVAPRTGKIIKITTNGILYFVYKLSQSSEIVLQSYNLHDEKLTFLKGAWH